MLAVEEKDEPGKTIGVLWENSDCSRGRFWVIMGARSVVPFGVD